MHKTRKAISSILLVLASVAWLFPVYIILTNSFKSREEMYANAIALPEHFSLSYYLDAMNRMDFLNAFKNSKSTYFAESQMNTGVNLAEGMGACEMGYIDILRMAIVDGMPLTQDLKYVQPDDGNADDQTVMQVGLPEPLLPGQEIKLSISFLSKLPRIVSRTGYERGDFYLVGQWFPKIGVYEPKGMRQRRSSGWRT